MFEVWYKENRFNSYLFDSEYETKEEALKRGRELETLFNLEVIYK